MEKALLTVGDKPLRYGIIDLQTCWVAAPIIPNFFSNKVRTSSKVSIGTLVLLGLTG